MTCRAVWRRSASFAHHRFGVVHSVCCVAVTDEVLAHWDAKGVTVVLMAPNSDWEMAGEAVHKHETSTSKVVAELKQKEKKNKANVRNVVTSKQTYPADLQEAVEQVLASAPAALPSFVSHLPKPVIVSALGDKLVDAIEASSRNRSCVGALAKFGPCSTRREDTAQEDEVRAAGEWRERVGGTEPVDAAARDVQRQVEARTAQHNVDSPLQLIRDASKHKGPASLADYESRKTEQQATGAIMLAASKLDSDALEPGKTPQRRTREQWASSKKQTSPPPG